MDATHAEPALLQLAELIRRHTPSDGTHPTAIPALMLMQAARLSEPMESVYKPSICVVAQGAKTATLADETYRYDPSTYLITSVELPIRGNIVEASAERPYLSLKLVFDPAEILELIQVTNLAPHDLNALPRGISVNRTNPDLLEALVRLLHLLDTPADLPVLAPLLLREILYRVLRSEHGVRLQQFALMGSHAGRIAEAIRTLNRDFDQPLAVEQLAKSVNLSPSAFHKHFKQVTAMSPLQYLKTVRLQEARRLMLVESLPAADAAFRVGYESPSQFSREYARMYGRPPRLDVQALRGSV